MYSHDRATEYGDWMVSPTSRATITDVAQLAGVAISSASAALNDRPGVSEETRARVQQAARKLRYVPSVRGKSLSSKRAYAVGLIVERDFSVIEHDPFFGAFIGGVEESLGPRGYALLLQVVQDATASSEKHLELIASSRVDGLLLSELRVNDLRVAAMAERGISAVGVNPGPGFPFPSVVQDSGAAIRELALHLHTQGHTRIAYVSGPLDYVHSIDRLTTWRQALATRNLAGAGFFEGDFTHAGGVAAADVLLSQSVRPTAVFCANDLMAIGFINRAVELGLQVPEDISVAGFDGISLGTYIRPTLTTISTDPHELGRRAAGLLLATIDGHELADASLSPSSLIVRHSTSPVSALT